MANIYKRERSGECSACKTAIAVGRCTIDWYGRVCEKCFLSAACCGFYPSRYRGCQTLSPSDAAQIVKEMRQGV